MSMKAFCVFVLCAVSVFGAISNTKAQDDLLQHIPRADRAAVGAAAIQASNGITSRRSHQSDAIGTAAFRSQPWRGQYSAGVAVQVVKSSTKQRVLGDCSQGRVAYIKCWLDEYGYVTGLAFENARGTRSPELCNTEGEHQEGGFLYDGESILDIISCRGPSGGISRMEFHTDGNRMHPITCGRGVQEVEPAEDSDEESHHDEEESHHEESVEDREWCESLTQGHVPQGGFEFGKKGPRSSNKYEYEMKESYPIAGLGAYCEDGRILGFKNRCWSTESNQPNVHNPVLVEAWVRLNDGPPDQVKSAVHKEECDPHLCSNSHTSRQLSAWAATAIPHLLAEIASQDVWVKHSILSCKACSRASGTWLQVALALYAQEGGLGALEHTLKAMLAWPERNLCQYRNVLIGCEQEGVAVLKMVNVWVKSTSAPQLMLT